MEQRDHVHVWIKCPLRHLINLRLVWSAKESGCNTKGSVITTASHSFAVLASWRGTAPRGGWERANQCEKCHWTSGKCTAQRCWLQHMFEKQEPSWTDCVRILSRGLVAPSQESWANAAPSVTLKLSITNSTSKKWCYLIQIERGNKALLIKLQCLCDRRIAIEELIWQQHHTGRKVCLNLSWLKMTLPK